MSHFLRALKSIAVIPQVGLSVVACVGAGIYTGMLLDNYFRIKPICIIVCGLMGMVAGILVAYNLLIREGKQGSDGSGKSSDE